MNSSPENKSDSQFAREFYDEIRSLLDMSDIPHVYRRMWRILDRMLKERTQHDEVEYFGLVPRIFALCRRYEAPQQPISILHSNIIKTVKGLYHPEPSDLVFDVKALATAIESFYNVSVPTDIAQHLPTHWRAWASSVRFSDTRICLIVNSWDEHYVYGYDTEDDTQSLLQVECGEEWKLQPQLYALATLNLLDVSTDDYGILHPRLIVLEPDYLIDITSICQCLKGDMASPMFYLMEKFMPREESLAIQLGNVSNQFLDDAIYGTGGKDSFLTSMQKSFKDYPLRYCTLEGIDEKFFDECRWQHDNIQHTVSHLFPQLGIDVEHVGVQLEPSFICDALGIQGRMDLLSTDLSKIVELKSGKQDDFHHTFRMEHALQMALYKEVLHYSLGRSRRDVSTFLLYSHYPQIHDIRLGHDHIVRAMVLRNGIVNIDRQLRTNAHDFLRNITEADFAPPSQPSKLYLNYIRPQILSFLNTLNEAASLEFDYFATMLSFVQREQSLAKIGDDRPDSDRGFAQAWLCDAENKRIHGYIVSDLRLHPIAGENGLYTHLRADLSSNNDAENADIGAFREGDSVILYERNNESDLMTNRQSIRCYVEELHPHYILLRFAYPQRVTSFLHEDSLYAIEPAHSDAMFNTLYRGLYALLTCSRHRRDFILGLRKPSVDDCYLLVGPPGSGKTNIALRRMVDDILSKDESQSILLMAYTNRAVDEICQMLDTMPSAPQYLRIGQELSCSPEFRPHLIRNVIAQCRNRRDILQCLAPVRIFCGTVASLSGMPELFQLRHFPTAILDEASQVLEPQLLPLLCATRKNGRMAIDKIVMIGDHKQLPAVVVQDTSRSAVSSELLRSVGLLNCRDSLFERLHRNAPEECCGMLTVQGRMHETISHFVAHRYYGDRLGIVPLPHQTESNCWTLYDSSDQLQTFIATHRMGALMVEPDANTSMNKQSTNEANEVAMIVLQIQRISKLNNQPWNPSRQVGIIVPFRAQIAVIRNALKKFFIPMYEDITIDTVERYQGSQRDIIIFSTVVCQPYQLQILSTPIDSEGQFIDRKLNVAITRARKQFFLVGNLPLLRQSPDYRALIEYCSLRESKESYLCASDAFLPQIR